MPDLILGGECSPDSWRLLVFSTGMNRAVVVRSKLEEAGAASKELPLSSALIRDFACQEGISPDSVYLCAPDDWIFFRTLTLPFSGKRKISQVLSFELEGTVPFKVENLLTDFQVLPGRTDDGYNILAAGADRKELASLVEIWTEAGADPDRVDSARSACQALHSFFADSLPADCAWLIADRNRLRVALIQGGKICSFAVSDVCFKQEESEAMSLSAAAMVRQQLLALGIPAAVERVVLAGDLAGEPEFVQNLEVAVQTPVQIFSDFGSGLFAEDQASPMTVNRLAIALGTALGSSRSGFNFLQGELAPARKKKRRKRVWLHPLVAALAVFVFYLGSSLYQISVLKAELHDLQSRAFQIVKSVSPGSAAKLRPSQYLSVLRSRVAEYQDDSGQNSRGQATVLNSLLSVSRSIPKNQKIEIRTMACAEQKVRMTGTAASFQAVDQFKQKLTGSGQFVQVMIKGVKTESSGGVSFTLEMEAKSV